jgi:hypothetical protein
LPAAGAGLGRSMADRPTAESPVCIERLEMTDTSSILAF